MDILGVDYYHIPHTCEKCGGIMIFKGVGEYHCENCRWVAYDDYGKVRNYIEEHRGANAADIEEGTGVSQKTIRRLLRESRLEVAESSRAFLHCEACNKAIRSGRFCQDCEMKYHRGLEEKQRELVRKEVQGFGMGKKAGEDGERRFMRRDE